MRGKPVIIDELQLSDGITPAGAGKTLLFCLRSRRRWDHPRRCGENPTIPKYHNDKKGSPPQVRGKHGNGFGQDGWWRITPAGAGKTYIKISFLSVLQDHPRRCGENSMLCCSWSWVWGSPPQVRGKRSCQKPNQVPTRITPAGAGKTLRKACKSVTHKDHPRRCGENANCQTHMTTSAGSPPQVRGKPVTAGAASKSRGITPAGAGKTDASLTTANVLRDHPRRCGENAAYALEPWRQAGSPPQVRGKLWYVACLNSCIGITPAGAGKTDAQIMHCFQHQDHPRRCGENRNDGGAVLGWRGSPPQVRGKLCNTFLMPYTFKITPAGAGKTKV